MKTAPVKRRLKAGGSQKSAKFGISKGSEAHIMTILRDTLYSDRILAVIREYASNAWDAHIDAGKADVPIRVTLPTLEDLTLRIRDYGPGLSEDQVFNVYIQFGESTKRGSNEAVGMLGIGCKSAFAYADTFTVVSYNGGFKCTYVAAIDETNRGEMHQIHKEPCGDETGVEVIVPVKHQDTQAFHQKARGLLKFFNPVPDANIDLSGGAKHRSYDAGFVLTYDDNYYRSNEWVAVMGCIPYRINVNEVACNDYYSVEASFLKNMSGGLYFDIGEVDVSATREELKYSERTKKALRKKIDAFIAEYISTIEAKIEKAKTGWDKRLIAWEASRSLGGSFAKKLSVGNERCQLFTEADPLKGVNVAQVVHFNPRLKFVIRDCGRARSGFSGYHDWIEVKRSDKSLSFAEVKKRLDARLKSANLDGAPVLMSSKLDWIKPSRYTNSYSADATKHKVNAFKFKDDFGYAYAKSNRWEIIDRVPKDDDPYVIISRFEPVNVPAFMNMRRSDITLAKKLNITLPPVFGYKTTKAKPKTDKDITGVRYDVWRKKFFKGKISKKILESFKAVSLYNIASQENSVNAQILAVLNEKLGEDHDIVKWFQTIRDATSNIRKHRDVISGIESFCSDFLPKNFADDFKALRKAVFAKYRLLTPVVHAVGHYSYKAIGVEDLLDYIALVDASEEKEEK